MPKFTAEVELELELEYDIEYGSSRLDPEEEEAYADNVRAFVTVNGKKVDITSSLSELEVLHLTDLANEDLADQPDAVPDDNNEPNDWLS